MVDVTQQYMDFQQQPPTSPDQEALAVLARAKEDPFMVEALLKLQKELFDMLGDIIHETSNSLQLPGTSAGTASAPGEVTSVVALRNQSRQRESSGRQKRELAEAMVIGALINRDNPNWDPFDPSTSQQPGENLILALLQMQPPGAPVTE